MEQKLGSSNTDVLAEPKRGGFNPSTEQRRDLDLSDRIPGWGIDLDPEVRPGVPRDKARLLGSDQLYPAFEQQVPTHKIFKSTEHAQLTPVFGTSCPPRGLSGLIRTAAYKLSEGRVPHWLMLMTADRIDVVEGLIEDLAHLHIPNIPKEMGWGAALKYNKVGLAKKVLVVGGLGAAALLVYRFIDEQQKLKAIFNYPSTGDERSDTI